MNLQEVFHKYFPEMGVRVEQLGLHDSNLSDIINIDDRTKEGVIAFVAAQLEETHDIVVGGNKQEIMMMADAQLSLALLLGVFLGERMKARFTLDEVYHNEH